MSVVFVVALSQASDAQIPATPGHGALMERKLASAQQILAGIAREDFAEIEKQAQRLTLLSQEAGWNVIQTPEYKRLSEDFRSASGQVKRSAAEQNIDAVGLAYVKLGISCIECHRHAKEQLIRTGEITPPDKSSTPIKR